MTLQLDASNFQATVLDTDQLVMVDFGAAWCYPCRQMDPVVDELAEENQGVVIGKVDYSADEDIAEEYGVFTLPAFLFFKNGVVVDQLVGPTSKHQLQELIQKHA